MHAKRSHRHVKRKEPVVPAYQGSVDDGNTQTNPACTKKCPSLQAVAAVHYMETEPMTGHLVIIFQRPVNLTGSPQDDVPDITPHLLWRQGDVDLGVSGDGRWDVSIQAVQCPVGSSKLEYKFQGSNPYYIKLQVRNAR